MLVYYIFPNHAADQPAHALSSDGYQQSRLSFWQSYLLPYQQRLKLPNTLPDHFIDISFSDIFFAALAAVLILLPLLVAG